MRKPSLQHGYYRRVGGTTCHRPRAGFTLIELLVVISIISLLISILMPSLSRARDQAKSVHCLARLKEYGNAIATYENAHNGLLPPAKWFPSAEEFSPEEAVRAEDFERPVEYGWQEILFSYIYGERVRIADNYPVQRNFESRRWQEYFLCKAAGEYGINSGHYRVYLPAWSMGSYALEAGEVYGLTTKADPMYAANRDRIRPKMPLIGDANEQSERGNGLGDNDCSYIDAGEANYAGSDGGHNGNRFSDRHYGGTNYLFQGLHAGWDTRLREELSRDFDLNGVMDVLLHP